MRIWGLLLVTGIVWGQSRPATPPVESQPRPAPAPVPASARANTGVPVLTTIRPVASGAVRVDELRSLDADTLRMLQQPRSAGGGAGGDDVGNGGDELRLAILQIGHVWSDEFPVLTPFLEARRILVVPELSVAGAPVDHVVVEGVLLLDRATWDGLLTNTFDARLVVARMLFELSGISVSEESLMRAWAKLPLSGGSIVCGHMDPATVARVSTQDFPARASLDAEAKALAACRAQGLVECRVAESAIVGFGSSRTASVVARGQLRQSRPATAAQVRAARCESIRSCEQAYEWAPAGQVGPADFARLGRAARETCGN